MINSEINSERKFLTGKIDRFKGKLAIIKTDDLQEVTWPIKDLPEDVEVGSLVRLILTTSKTDQEEQEKIAKTILNKIFNQ